MNITLYNPQQGHAVLKDLWPKIKATLMTGQKLRIEIKQSRRSAEQNDMFHGIIHKIHIAMKAVGSKWTADDWKRLLIDQWAHETNRKIGKVAPSLDGERVVQLGLQSHKFTIEDGSEFIEWLLAWSADKGIDVA
jgi:hypothetical protein